MNAPEKAQPQGPADQHLPDTGNEVEKTKSTLRPEGLTWHAQADLIEEAGRSADVIAQSEAFTSAGRKDEKSPTPADSTKEAWHLPDESAELLEIDRNRLKKRGFIVPDGPRTRTIQEFRGVKRSLLLNAMSSDYDQESLGRLIMITSALPGEGKTFCAINLALSLVEEKDYSVLLIDGDVALPSIPDVLGIPKTPGLIDALADPNIDVRSLIHPTSIPKLSYLSAGKPHHQATELLASSAMRELLSQIVSIDSRQIIIFDSPPLLVSTEAPGLPPHMGQIVLVVEIGNTRRSAIKDALSVIDRDDDSVTILLNKASGGRSSSGYAGYGYGYGYGREK